MTFDDSDLISGWRYSATLQLRTPLAYLKRDDEFSPGPQEPPMVGPAEGNLPGGTGFNPYGIWLREIDYNGLGFDPHRPGNCLGRGGWSHFDATVLGLPKRYLKPTFAPQLL